MSFALLDMLYGTMSGSFFGGLAILGLAVIGVLLFLTLIARIPLFMGFLLILPALWGLADAQVFGEWSIGVVLIVIGLMLGWLILRLYQH